MLGQVAPEALAHAIPEGITELWKKYFLAKISHDLTIETADGNVTAHAQMLKEASPVVRAMLESPMKESQAQRIEMTDTASRAVSLFLEFLGDEKLFFCFKFNDFPRSFHVQHDGSPNTRPTQNQCTMYSGFVFQTRVPVCLAHLFLKLTSC